METNREYFSAEPFEGVVVFDGPAMHLGAVRERDFPMAQMPRLMDGTFSGLFGALERVGATRCGPPLAWHYRMPTDTVDLAVGVPLTEPLVGELELESGFRVVPTPCPSGRVAATSYFGSYEGLGAAWGRFMDEVTASGHVAKTEFFEVYVSNPVEVADLSLLRTDLMLFID